MRTWGNFSCFAVLVTAGLFLVSGQAQARSDPPATRTFTLAAKKKPRKKKRKKTKADPGTGILAYDKILELNGDLLKIIKKNQNDCDKVVSALKAYSEKKQARYAKLAKQRDEAIAKMSSEQRQALTKRVEEKMYQITRNYWDVIGEVDQRCLYQKAEIHMYLSMFK